LPSRGPGKLPPPAGASAPLILGWLFNARAHVLTKHDHALAIDAREVTTWIGGDRHDDCRRGLPLLDHRGAAVAGGIFQLSCCAGDQMLRSSFPLLNHQIRIALGYLKKSPRLITGHSPSIASYFATRNAASHSARV
jgi:hypothetical protein